MVARHALLLGGLIGLLASWPAIAGNASAPAPAAAATDTPTPALAERFQSARFHAHDGRELPYRLLVPAAAAEGTPLPLVVVLHGSGAIGTDNQRQLGPFSLDWARDDVAARYPAYVLVPQFPVRSANYADDPDDGLAASQGSDWLPTALELVAHIATSAHVNPDRVYVVGFSMGASASWNALLLAPDRFAAAVAIAGVPPARQHAPALREVPLLVLHGDADTENPIGPDRAMIRALREAGANATVFREYPGLDHRIPDDVLRANGWRDWLFSQRR